ncbi:MAG: hypothetical protein ACLFPO_05125 [Spirochaetaceae bacterium]
MRKTSRYLLVLVVYIIASEGIHAQAVDIRIRNETEYRMQELYVFSDPQGPRGENLISGSPLFPGREITVENAADAEFVLAVDSEGDRYLKRDVDVEETLSYGITLDDLYFGEDTSAAGEWQLRVVNDTNYRLTGLFYRVSGDREWTKIDVDSPVRAGDLVTGTIPISGGTTSIELRAEDEDGDVYRKSGIRTDDTRSVRLTFDDLQW